MAIMGRVQDVGRSQPCHRGLGPEVGAGRGSGTMADHPWKALPLNPQLARFFEQFWGALVVQLAF